MNTRGNVIFIIGLLLSFSSVSLIAMKSNNKAKAQRTVHYARLQHEQNPNFSYKDILFNKKHLRNTRAYNEYLVNCLIACELIQNAHDDFTWLTAQFPLLLKPNDFWIMDFKDNISKLLAQAVKQRAPETCKVLINFIKTYNWKAVSSKKFVLNAVFKKLVSVLCSLEASYKKSGVHDLSTHPDNKFFNEIKSALYDWVQSWGVAFRSGPFNKFVKETLEKRSLDVAHVLIELWSLTIKNIDTARKTIVSLIEMIANCGLSHDKQGKKLIATLTQCALDELGLNAYEAAFKAYDYYDTSDSRKARAKSIMNILEARGYYGATDIMSTIREDNECRRQREKEWAQRADNSFHYFGGGDDMSKIW